MVGRIVLLLLVTLAAVGCSTLGDLAGRQPAAPTVTRLHVFNRTEEAVFLIDETGRRLDVPACGEAVDEQFGMDMVQVRTEIGYVFAFGAPAENPLAPEPQFLVLVAEPGESFPEPERPTQLPPCSGRNQSQPGV